MKKMNRLLCMVLAVCMLLGMFPFPQAAASSDYLLYGNAENIHDDVYQLTELETWQSGGIWIREPINTQRDFTVSFSYNAGGGRSYSYGGADGIVLAFSPEIGLGSDGEYMGFISGEAYGVEFDSYAGNLNDPAGKHIAVIHGQSSNHLAYTLDDRVDDSEWHDVEISYTDNSITVKLDDATVLLCRDVVLADETYLGLSAATGSGKNQHLVSSFKYEYTGDNNGAGNSVNVSADTWSFQNPTGLGGEKYWSFWYPALKAKALHEYASQAKGGLCYGMVLSSMALNSKSQSPADFSAGSVSAIDKASVSKTLGITALEYVRYLFPIQISSAVWDERSANNNDLNGLYNTIKAYENGENDGVEISIRGQYLFERQGHSLWGIRAIDEDESCRIVVYDCNHPKEERYLTLNKNENGDFVSWSYDIGLIGASAWGTGKKNAEISYGAYSEAFYEMLQDELMGFEKVFKGDFEQKYLVALSEGAATSADLDEIVINGVVEQTGPETPKQSAETLYWSGSDTISVSGDENGIGASLIGMGSGIEISSETGKYATLKLGNRGADTVLLQTVSGGGIEAVFSVDDADEIQTYFSISGNTGTEEVVGENEDGSVILSGLTDFSATVSQEARNKDGNPVTTAKAGCRADRLNPNHSYKISTDNAIQKILVHEDTNGDGDFDTVVDTLPTTLFTDVSVDAYYYDAVLWAVENGITSGTSATTFSPNASCTRAQMATFLWRAAGTPEPAAKICSFTDVDKDSYYYKAVLWAMENNITMGTSTKTFSPNAPCSRGQMAAFLYRYSNSPVITGTQPFQDVSNSAFYYDAVTWAVQNKITEGTSATTFSPAARCTRGQMVTFLYRLLGR